MSCEVNGMLPQVEPPRDSRIISDYPADADLTGWPAEKVDLTLILPDGIAANAAEAHGKIQALIEPGEFSEIPSADDEPFEFAPELTWEVVGSEG